MYVWLFFALINKSLIISLEDIAQTIKNNLNIIQKVYVVNIDLKLDKT